MKPPEIASDFLEEFATVLKPERVTSRVNVDPEQVEQGLMKLVLVLVELLRQVLERQAIRRMEAGSLSGEEIDRLGTTLMRLEEKVKELQDYFQIDDLNINLGPLGNLID
jgi:hypothetical protein